MKYNRLGDLLISVGLITQEQLDHALKQQKHTKNRLGQQLIQESIITEQQLIDALRMQLGVEFIDLNDFIPEARLASMVPKATAERFDVVPVRAEQDAIYLAMSDPLNFMAIEAVKATTRKRIIPMISTARGIEHAMLGLYGNEGATRAIEDMRRERSLTSQAQPADTALTAAAGEGTAAPTVRLVNSILERGALDAASDIHIEPRENDLHVRMRVDGLMRSMMFVPKDLQASVISRLKVMGGMDVTERRVAQDGRAVFTAKNREFDMRMSTLPTIFGEKVAIRLLEKNSGLLHKDKIGLCPDDMAKYMNLISRPSGVVLIVGPTGSGKSSTMYTMIHELNTQHVNLVTLEDPVEYHVNGVTQVQIQEKTGLTFANGLRSVLRQDPDIIAIGEIRDSDTAHIAMRAAITGHLVLSTVHTNDAISTIDRLLDIGVEPYIISSALNGVISQRLVRRICPNCRAAYTPASEEVLSLGLEAHTTVQVYRGAGCPACAGTGYLGRTGVFEILMLSQALRLAISRGAGREEVERIIRQEGRFVPMASRVRELVLSGITTVEEAQRTVFVAEDV